MVGVSNNGVIRLQLDNAIDNVIDNAMANAVLDNILMIETPLNLSD